MRVSVVQTCTQAYDLDATLQKLQEMVDICRNRDSSQLAVFPEAFIGGYPKYSHFGAVVGERSDEGRNEYVRYHKAAIEVPSPATTRVEAISRDSGIFLVVGVIERDGGSLYCAVIFVSPTEGLVGKHRKIMPTGAERLVWAQGDGSTLPVIKTTLVGENAPVSVSATICWENYMPLLRYHYYSLGTQIYCAPTVDARESWQSTMTHIALEGRCFVLAACQFAQEKHFTANHAVADSAKRNPENIMIAGGSVIISPQGKILAGPLRGEEGVLTVDIDLDDIVRGKYDLDVCGNYARPDIFQLTAFKGIPVCELFSKRRGPVWRCPVLQSMTGQAFRPRADASSRFWLRFALEGSRLLLPARQQQRGKGSGCTGRSMYHDGTASFKKLDSFLVEAPRKLVLFASWMPSPLHITPVVFNCPPTEHDPPGRVLKMSAKWYWSDESLANVDGVSLLFAHCIGSHKEQWEPVIETCIVNQRGKPRHQRVREAWAFDWQSHGDSAVLNREQIAQTRQNGVSAFEYAAAVKAFVLSARMEGRHMVAVGHSAGAAAMLLAASDLPRAGRAYPYQAVVLVEPSLASPQIFFKHIAPLHPALVAATQMRRSKWSSRQEAASWFAKRRPWKTWDKRAVRAFVEHGLVDSEADGGVHLKCDPRQEALAFPDLEPHFAALDEIGRISRAVPMHVVWARRSEILSSSVQDALVDESLGRVAASVTRVEGGHLVVQDNDSLLPLIHHDLPRRPPLRQSF
uniref:CN hydrolase domain-containing protein n=1 Tax=Mycena chlorophos TaxID=658473 RepID=A0ABQ0LPI3_MYCCL|nr:predicted protein [Mycena chlorophos]